MQHSQLAKVPPVTEVLTVVEPVTSSVPNSVLIHNRNLTLPRA